MIYLYLTLTTVFWAAVFHLGKFVVQLMPAMGVAAWRFLLAALALGIYVVIKQQWQWASFKRNWLPLLIMGVVGIFGFNAAMFVGLKTTSSVNASLIMAFYPAVTALLSAMLGGARVSRAQWLGFALSLLGVASIIGQGSWQVLTQLHFAQGDLLMLLACLCWAVYSVIPGRFVRDMASLPLTLSTLVIGALALATVAELQGALRVAPTLPMVAALLTIALLGTVLAYLWWNQGVQQLGPASVSMFLNLTPVFTVLIGVLLGEPFQAAQGWGALLVISGVLLATGSLPQLARQR